MQRDVPVREVMDREFVAASPSDSLFATVELMLREEAEPAVVLEGAELVGVLGDRDVIARLLADDDPEAATVADAMTESVPTANPEQTLDEARDAMAAWSTGWLIVTEGKTPEGVVTEYDVLTSSTLGNEINATEQPTGDEQIVAAGANAAASESNVSETSGFEEQAICERCGTLSHDVSSINGQLLCGDCRDM